MKYLEQLFAFDFTKGSLLNPSAREVIEHIDFTYLVIVLLFKFNSCFLLLNIQLVNSVVLKDRLCEFPFPQGYPKRMRLLMTNLNLLNLTFLRLHFICCFKMKSFFIMID